MKPPLKQIFDTVLLANKMSEEYYNENKKSRLREIITIRQTVSLVGQDYGHSQQSIGDFLGIDHSTVHHNKMMARRYCECEKEYFEMVKKVMSELNRPASNYRCSDCEVFKNHQGTNFFFGFHCPIKDSYVNRDEFACEYILADNMPF
jgi:hypothetical protein